MAKKAVRLKVTDRDRGWRKLKRTLATTTKPYVEVGVRGEDDARPGGEIGNVELAAVHEFGAAAGPLGEIDIPERSFIRSTIDEHLKEYRALLGKLGRQIYTLRMRPKQALAILGLKATSDMRRMIERGGPGNWPALAPSTIARKGTDKKLIDTGLLKASITSKVFAR